MSMHHLLQILGLTILHMLWIGGLIGGVVFVCLRFNRTSAPQTRYVASVCGLVALAIGIISTFTILASTGTVQTVLPADAIIAPTVEGSQRLAETTSQNRDFDSEASSLGLSPTSAIACAWILGITLMSVRLFRQWISVRRLRLVGIAEPALAWTRKFDALKSTIGVHDRVSMLVSDAIDAPMVVGWIRPLVLVPAVAFTSLTPEQLRTILAHELLHIARRDHLVNMLQAFIEVLLFFHPVTWWLSRQIRVERENCCDDGALLVTSSPRSLAEALLVLESLRSAKIISPQLLTATGGSLMHRISRLFGSSQPQPLNAGWRAISVCTLLAVAGLTFATATTESTAIAQDRGATDDKRVEADVAGDIPHDKRKARIEERLRAMGVDIRRQVADGEITAEEGRKKFAKAEERMSRRIRMAEEQAGENRPASRELEELKRSIEARIEGMWVDLREQVAAGEISEADAKARFEEGERRMWMRYRAAEEKKAGGRKDVGTADRELEELKRSIEARIEGMWVDLREQVAAGKISEADAKARFEEGERRMWTRYRAAEMKQRLEGMKRGPAKDRAIDGRREMTRDDYDAAVEKMTEMVKAGKITREQMQQRLEGMKQPRNRKDEDGDR
ncbi:MAG: M48 family metalloprotease [Phycisphaera sp.]|nr:M48 family metalloprotease [Phycisphaera sp.]